MNAISIHNLTKTYASGTQALKGVDLEVGANGAGKTTIIGILTGLVNKTAGKARGAPFLSRVRARFQFGGFGVALRGPTPVSSATLDRPYNCVV